MIEPLVVILLYRIHLMDSLYTMEKSAAEHFQQNNSNMMKILVCITVLYSTANADIVYPKCTMPVSGKLQFAPEAINCEDKISDDACMTFFPTAVKLGNNDDRHDNCYKVRKIALVEFLDSYISCSSVTPDMCTHPTWKPIMAENCPKKCGLCADTGECSDAIPGCNIDPSICFNNQLQEFVKANCKRTCGYCKDSATASPLISKIQFTTK
ncbi:shTK domain protein [Dictyocaulus viviparus]|uniref:ShTK domain protein n=1 Tax=Dictyocaulus viviparus TaxID=29172 RepID=A0A0D8X730_DICVI|nr:shTK domain protein [Dictyocaulus viviparus]